MNILKLGTSWLRQKIAPVLSFSLEFAVASLVSLMIHGMTSSSLPRKKTDFGIRTLAFIACGGQGQTSSIQAKLEARVKTGGNGSSSSTKRKATVKQTAGPVANRNVLR
eukprot:5905601-Amphidinium_carterae.1